MSGGAVVFERVRAALSDRPFSLELDWRVGAGEWVAVVGPSGAGKSVILGLAAGLLEPDEGRVLVLGKAWTDGSEAQLTALRVRVGAALQPPGLLSNMTLFNNVALPLRYHRSSSSALDIDRTVTAHLDRMELLSAKDRFPAQLNVGEIRRAAIVRALVPEPDVLLLDDPVDGLDVDLLGKLRSYLETAREAKPLAVLMTLRAWSPLAECADRVAAVRDGRIVLDGPVAQVRAAADPDLRRYLG